LWKMGVDCLRSHLQNGTDESLQPVLLRMPQIQPRSEWDGGFRFWLGLLKLCLVIRTYFPAFCSLRQQAITA